MAAITPKSVVTLDRKVAGEFRFPPPTGAGDLVIAVASGALQSSSTLTTVVRLDGAVVRWVASLDEASLVATGTSTTDARRKIAELLFVGDATWNVIEPGDLRLNVGKRTDTVYQGTRPWLVVAGPHPCGVLAMPLNDRGAAVLRKFECEIDSAALQIPNAKPSKLELAHIWSFPKGVRVIGLLDESARRVVRRCIESFYA